MLSFSVGVYDLFSYTIPGILYLFVGNESMRVLGFPYLKYTDISTPINIALLIFAAFILGHALDFVADKWKRLGEKKNVSTRAVEILKSNYPDLNIKFQPNERALLFAFIRRNHDDIKSTLDRTKAISILFQNISLGLLLYAAFLFITMLGVGYKSSDFAFLIASLVLSFVTRQRSRMFNLWFNSLVFEVALTYGTSTEEILKGSRLKKATQNNRA